MTILEYQQLTREVPENGEIFSFAPAAAISSGTTATSTMASESTKKSEITSENTGSIGGLFGKQKAVGTLPPAQVHKESVVGQAGTNSSYTTSSTTSTAAISPVLVPASPNVEQVR